MQLLKEQLAELNSSVELKETIELDLMEPFRSSHYFDDFGDYEEPIAKFIDLRQAMRTPTRDGHWSGHFSPLPIFQRAALLGEKVLYI